ncbi:MAG: ABC transporter permease [Pyrinomonadaceae bacterium]|nr:ABC transporter permease [Pyrinomonadaceae bacterium]
MSKLLAIIKREYWQGIRSKVFIISTVLGPLLAVGGAVVPGLLFRVKTGDATRLAVVDQTNRLYESVQKALLREGREEVRSNSALESGTDAVREVSEDSDAVSVRYKLEQVPLKGRSSEEIKAELNEQIRKDQLDAYIVLTPNVLADGQVQFYGRNVGDVITIEQIRDRLSRTLIEERMRDAGIDGDRVRELSRGVRLNTIKVSEQGEDNDSGSSFGFAFAIVLFIYVAVLMYGQVILSAVVEDKTTRIAEVLFSSVSAFPLIAGKLIGVALLALTQYVIWAFAFGLFALYGVGAIAASGMNLRLPTIAPSFVVYALLFFLLGFFIYTTIYALVGAMVTSEKEGGQVSFPIIFLLIISVYLAFPVIRSPNSAFSFWVSMFPFFSPITMLVRIVTETPPFWQIALSLLIGFATVVILVWLAARIYRVGMLMHGKRATIPEVLRWIRQT